MSIDIKEETDLEFGTAEVTLTFLVSHLNWYAQDQFIKEMDQECFGIAEEGEYHTMSPPLLVGGKLLKTATFTFSSLPDVKGKVSVAVAAAVGDALDIARRHKAHLLSASHRIEEVEAA